ncbi:hypothetical protein ACFUJ0_16990, partial [Streptomyces sp. NPDC057242]
MNHVDTTTAARRRPIRACALAASTAALLVPQTRTASPATAATPDAARGVAAGSCTAARGGAPGWGARG